MGEYKVITVESRRDLKKFVKFPRELYKDCPQYVPALDSDQLDTLTKNAALEYCTQKLWMVMDGKKVVGRICAMINPRYNELYQKKRVRFGWFDAIDDIKVAQLLLSTAETWAKEHGMDEVHGPLFYNTLGKQGMLVEGYENMPPFNCLYNYPYYNDFMIRLGYEKEYDWIQYKIKADQGVPDRVRSIAERLQERYKLHEADIDQLKKDRKMVKRFFEIYNDCFSGIVYNFIPFTEAEAAEEAKMSISMLDKKLSALVMDENNDFAAFGIAFPSLSTALKKCNGHLFPFGWIHLLRAMKNYENIDLMLTGAAPKWQNTGVSSIFHVLMATAFQRAGCKVAITNPQIETNTAINVWDRYEFKELYMRRRCYIKSI